MVDGVLMSSEITEYAIGRISLKAGDVLVVKYHNIGAVKQEWVDRLREFMNKAIGDTPVIVIGDDIDLAVLTKDEIDARAEPVRLAPKRIVELPAE